MKEKVAHVDVRNEIYREALKLFLQKGYEGTSIEDITHAANISKGAFYWHFSSKTELLETIIDDFEKVVLDSMINAVENTEGDFTRKFKLSHKLTTELAYKNRELCVGFVTLSAECVGSGTDIDEKLRKVYVKFVQFFRKLLEIGKSEGKLRPELDLKATAHVILGIHNGALLEWYMNVDGVDGASLAKTYRDVSLWGILREKKR